SPIEELDCDTAEVTLLFSSSPPSIFVPYVLGKPLDSEMFVDGEITVVVPQGVSVFDFFYLGENQTGSLDFYTGVGAGPEEETFLLRSQPFIDDVPTLLHLGPVVTVKMPKEFFFSLDVSAIKTTLNIFSYSPVGFDIISSGASSTLQNTIEEITIQVNYGLGAVVTLTGSASFDPSVHTTINASCTDYDDVIISQTSIAESTGIEWSSQCRFLKISYVGSLQPEDVKWRSSERIDLRLTAVELP
ncbi:hypothetical protein PFISCL1PPCAC_7635, partial [Pristionchus fissidentatus]